MIFALAARYFKSEQIPAWITLLIFPLLFGISIVDFTEKRQWKEQVTENSYTANFEYFNGRHEIPLTLEKGETVTTYVTFSPDNGGGHGYRVRDENNQLIALQLIEEATDPYEQMNTSGFQFTVKATGIYKLTITGDELGGKIEVSWEVE